MKRVTKTRIGLFDIMLLGLVAFLIFITLYPLYYVAINSISNSLMVNRREVNFIPKGVNLESYRIVLSDPMILRAYANTILYTSVGTTINLILTAMCAYPLSIRGFFGRKQFTFYVVFTMLFSGGLIPRYLVVRSLGMLDTIWSLVLPTAVSAWYMFIMRTYFAGIPDSLRESAFMDGANDIVVMVKIIIPLSMPVLAALTIFYSVGHWNSFFASLIYINSSKKYPLQIILRNIVISHQLSAFDSDIGEGSDFLVGEQTIKYAVIMVSTLPILFVYPFMQRHFAKGIQIGAVKG
jgi:putative aldouronate transport system permease protein